MKPVSPYNEYVNVLCVTNRTKSDEDRETRPDDDYFKRNNIPVPTNGFYNKSLFDGFDDFYLLDNPTIDEEKSDNFESEQPKMCDDRVVEKPMDVEDNDTQELVDEVTDDSQEVVRNNATVQDAPCDVNAFSFNDGINSKRRKADYEACLQSPGWWKFIVENPFCEPCEVCKQDFTTKPMFMLHPTCYGHRLKNKHRKSGVATRGKLFECLECDKRFKTKLTLSSHSLIHYDPRFACKLCPFTSQSQLQKAEEHEDTHKREYKALFDGHVEEKVKQTDEAIGDAVVEEDVHNADDNETPNSERSKNANPNSDATTSLSSPASDNAHRDDGNQDYCDVCLTDGTGELLCCDRCLRSYHLTCLEPALEEVTEDKWSCPKCEAEGVQLREEQKPIRTTSSWKGFDPKIFEDIPFSKRCDMCCTQFHAKYSFMLHEPCYIQKLERNHQNNPVKNDDHKKFECLECDKRYRTRYDLGSHARRHYEPRFKCKLCTYTTNYSFRIPGHQRKHKSFNIASKSKEPAQSTSKDSVGFEKNHSPNRVVLVQKTNNRKEYRVKFGRDQVPKKSQDKTSTPAYRFSKKCDLCRRKFSSLPMFVLHTSCFNIKLARAGKKPRVQAGDPWECIKCDKIFTQRPSITNHVMKNHKF